jgi:hypothetical protein
MSGSLRVKPDNLEEDFNAATRGFAISAGRCTGRHGVRNDPDAVGRRAARSCGRAGATPARLEADELPEHFDEGGEPRSWAHRP